MSRLLLALLLAQDAQSYLKSGIDKLGKDDFQGAMADFTKAIELDPKLAKAYTKRGRTFWRIGKSDAAIQDCTKAIEIDSRDAEAYN